MQQNFYVGNMENYKPFLVIVLESHDWIKTCNTKEISL